jgi:hypothetical protein
MQASNNIRKIVVNKNSRKKVDMMVVAPNKIDLLEHIMLYQFDGPDEFYAAHDAVIERFRAYDEE